MTKREMVEAMLAGRTLVDDQGYEAYFKPSRMNPWVLLPVSGEEATLDGGWNWATWHIKEEPKKRLMTRNEILGFIANTSGIVIKRNEDKKWVQANYYNFISETELYQWAYIDTKGNIGEPHKFEIVDDE